MTWVVAGLALLVLVWVLMRTFVAATPGQLMQGIRWAGVGLGGAAALALLFSGRGGAALALAAGLFPLFMRWRRMHAPPSGAGSEPSEVETEWLRMALDHDTGHMEGTVRKGPFQGRRLAELERDELMTLWRELRADDEPSSRLLETWLDRAWPDWRAGDETPRRSAHMTPAEALDVLDLEPGASEAEIRSAHRRLMLKVHPDHGGSTWMAARLNEARDVLLGEAG
jgi:hypothetical protein